ncbi:hypothetical protein FC56_GL000314 [Lentilactobacillus senioris DSM 24302 = JCM 17472]|uniref:Helix-turn-helix domain-containing protein n=1 Tax=Lentilactobacillus senioris DSM 24302 = JCM 17472 TaxID=1423802 RepID=A0A0R2CPD1_9LACO|nr:hypothetical protein [Lentilactobacillus senioris]KRM93598.1 hypothetical protein FC56_GL000314 [Lentilactobacillus senioris DSM 24302 = JCM 17472]
MAISVPLELPEEALEQIKATMFETAVEAFKTAGKKQDFPNWMNLTQTAGYMGVSKATLNNFIKQGLKVATINGIQRVCQNEADRFFIEHQI